MKFEKGKPKSGGRKKGTPNAVTKDLRERIRELLESKFEQVEADFSSLEPKDRLNAWLKMSEFVLPKMQRNELSFDLSKLTDAEIETLFDKAVKKMY